MEMAKNAPGKAHREGLTVVELMDMFPTEEAANKWFESIIWPDGRHCPKCGSVRTREASHKYMPLLVHGLPLLLLGKDGNRHAGIESPDAEMGDCHLPVPDFAQVGFVHEAEA